MVVSHHHVRSALAILSLVVLCIGSGGLALVPPLSMDQPALEGQQHHDANQKAIAELAQAQKADTARRAASPSIPLGIGLSQASRSCAGSPQIEPDGQTDHRPPTRPLRQYISVYRI